MNYQVLSTQSDTTQLFKVYLMNSPWRLYNHSTISSSNACGISNECSMSRDFRWNFNTAEDFGCMFRGSIPRIPEPIFCNEQAALCKSERVEKSQYFTQKINNTLNELGFIAQFKAKHTKCSLELRFAKTADNQT